MNFTEHKSGSYFAQQANTSKERGFYVDIGENDNILSPDTIFEDDYINDYKIVEEFNEVISKYVNYLSSHCASNEDSKNKLLGGATAMVTYFIFIEAKFAELRKQQKKNLNST